MSEITIGDRFMPSDDAVARELDGESVLLNVASGIYFGLDRVGTRIWQLIDAHRSLDAVLARLREEYDAPSAVLERDLIRLTGELVQKGLLVRT